jgi:hypothetical protein
MARTGARGNCRTAPTERSLRTHLRLQVVLRVPIRVEDHHGVCGSQVDAHAAGLRRDMA